MTNSFWTGGPAAYAKGLRKQYKPLLDELRKRRELADQAERVRLDFEIDRLESEYKSKRDSIDDTIF